MCFLLCVLILEMCVFVFTYVCKCLVLSMRVIVCFLLFVCVSHGCFGFYRYDCVVCFCVSHIDLRVCPCRVVFSEHNFLTRIWNVLVVGQSWLMYICTLFFCLSSTYYTGKVRPPSPVILHTSLVPSSYSGGFITYVLRLRKCYISKRVALLPCVVSFFLHLLLQTTSRDCGPHPTHEVWG